MRVASSCSFTKYLWEVWPHPLSCLLSGICTHSWHPLSLPESNSPSSHSLSSQERSPNPFMTLCCLSAACPCLCPGEHRTGPGTQTLSQQGWIRGIITLLELLTAPFSSLSTSLWPICFIKHFPKWFCFFSCSLLFTHCVKVWTAQLDDGCPEAFKQFRRDKTFRSKVPWCIFCSKQFSKIYCWVELRGQWSGRQKPAELNSK